MQFECVTWEILCVGKFEVFMSLGYSFVVVCVIFEWILLRRGKFEQFECKGNL